MRDIPRSLSVALIAGIASVVAASVPLAASTAGNQVVITSTTDTQMPAFMRALGNIFAGGMMRQMTAPVNVTETYSQNRSRVDNASDGTSTIQECDLQRTIHLDNKMKQYAIVPFSDYMKELEQTTEQMSKILTSSGGAGTGQVKITLAEHADNQTKIIVGQTAHHVIQDVQFDKTGTGNCISYNVSMHTELWYMTNPLPGGYCPLEPVQNKAAAQMAQRNMQGQCMQQMRASANTKGNLATRFPLDEALTMSLNGSNMGGSHTVVNSIVTQPYDASLFDIPAGYTQATPPPATPGT